VATWGRARRSILPARLAPTTKGGEGGEGWSASLAPHPSVRPALRGGEGKGKRSASRVLPPDPAGRGRNGDQPARRGEILCDASRASPRGKIFVLIRWGDVE
jgi:hypothetical protein